MKTEVWRGEDFVLQVTPDATAAGKSYTIEIRAPRE